MKLLNTLLPLSALASFATAHPTLANSTPVELEARGPIGDLIPKNATIVDLDVAALELEFELSILIENGVLQVDFEVEIGDLELVDIDSDIPLPELPIKRENDAEEDTIHLAAPPHRVAHENETTVAIEPRTMADIKCSLPHTRLAPGAGEVFRAHFAALRKATTTGSSVPGASSGREPGTYFIPAFKHIIWKIGNDRFRVENWTGKDMKELKYADAEFAAQQMGLVCPLSCKGKGCKAKSEVAEGKIMNRIYSKKA